jgi:hypothetical protein
MTVRLGAIGAIGASANVPHLTSMKQRRCVAMLLGLFGMGGKRANHGCGSFSILW